MLPQTSTITEKKEHRLHASLKWQRPYKKTNLNKTNRYKAKCQSQVVRSFFDSNLFYKYIMLILEWKKKRKKNKQTNMVFDEDWNKMVK